jgi:pimeloyl-ACP methyl ester carboxylesterase
MGAPVGTPAREDQIQLVDGRRLAFAEWGDLTGRPVLYFHGMPHSRRFFPDPAAAETSGVRAISVDRPGVGASDPQPGHRIADWPADVTALADALGLERIGVLGWSAGVSYTLACAALIPDRLTGAAVTSSNAALAYLLDEDPEPAWLDDDDRAVIAALPQGLEAAAAVASELGDEWVRGVQTRPETIIEGTTDPGDEWFFDDPARRKAFLDAVRDAVRQGVAGIAPLWVAPLAPWGFRLEDIAMPVHLWTGANDLRTPPDQMRRLAEHIPNHTLTVWEDVGHLGIAKYMPDVLAEL